MKIYLPKHGELFKALNKKHGFYYSQTTQVESAPKKFASITEPVIFYCAGRHTHIDKERAAKRQRSRFIDVIYAKYYCADPKEQRRAIVTFSLKLSQWSFERINEAPGVPVGRRTQACPIQSTHEI